MIYIGKLLEQTDLDVYIYYNNALIDPFSIFYSIFDCTKGKSELIKQTAHSQPMRFDIGSYFVPIRINPILFTTGRHLVKWQIQQNQGDEIKQVTEEFDVVRTANYAGEFFKSTYANSTKVHL